MYGCRKARAGSTWKNGTDAATAPTLAGRECRAGLDLSTTTDLSALVLVFRDEDDGYTLLPVAFCPAYTIHERQRRDRVDYGTCRQQGPETAKLCVLAIYDQCQRLSDLQARSG